MIIIVMNILTKLTDDLECIGIVSSNNEILTESQRGTTEYGMYQMSI